MRLGRVDFTMYFLFYVIGIIFGVVINVPNVEVQTIEPSFDVPVVNVTAIAGETAILPCSVHMLGDHVVAWMAPGEKLMTLETRRIIADQRITVERPFTRDWNLFIHGVRHQDSGKYMCQINTSPVKIKYVQLFVQEAPKIHDEGTTTHVLAREGETVNISCNVSGVPTPQVSWYRRSSHNEHTAKEKIGKDGETLIIHNISRYCDDIYECVAFNNIEPSASKEIRVEVQFPPEISLLNKRISQQRDKETIMECAISANPQAYSAWTRNGRTLSNLDPRNSAPKYRTEIYEDGPHTITLSLRILIIDGEDFGVYRCVAENNLGKDSEEMILSELLPATKAPTTQTTTTTTRKSYWNGRVTYRPQTMAPKPYPSNDIVGSSESRGPNRGQQRVGPGYSSQGSDVGGRGVKISNSFLLILCCAIFLKFLEVT